jgi:hypothetical protein
LQVRLNSAMNGMCVSAWASLGVYDDAATFGLSQADEVAVKQFIVIFENENS